MSRPGEDSFVVDQILFGPGPDGVEPMRSSISTAHRAEVWKNRLLPLVRLESFSAYPAPNTSLSYFSFGQKEPEVVVLRREDSGRTNGRGVAHALIGSPQVLVPYRALALQGWPGWVGKILDDTVAPTLDGRTLPSDPPPPVINEEFLVEFVAAVLRAPSPHLTVVGAYQEDPIQLMHGLVDVLGPLFEGTDRQRRWTFSGYEREVSASCKNAAEIAFLPALVDGATKAGQLVDLSQDGSADRDWQAEVAKRLVEQYFRAGPGAVADGLRTSGATHDTLFSLRLEVLRHFYSGGPPLPQPTRVAAVSQSSVQPVQVEVVPVPKDTPAQQYRSESLSEHRRLVARLKDAKTEAEVHEVVGQLVELGPAAGAVERRWIRDELLTPKFLDRRLDDLGRITSQLYPVVIAQSFGNQLQDLRADETPTLVSVSNLVGRHETSPYLTGELLFQASRAGKVELLLAAFGLREVRGRGLFIAEPDWAAHFCPDPARHDPVKAPPPGAGLPDPWRGSGLSLGRLIADNRAVVSVTLVLVFLIGLLVGVLNGG
jgi:hypothetical protein